MPNALAALAVLVVPQVAERDPPPPGAGAVRDLAQVGLGETVVTPSRRATPGLEAPWSVVEIDATRILEQAYRTTPQALRDVPGVLVQETAYGQGSPYIRGFTGFRTLLLIDGIRLNHSAMREGPNQYWSTLDPLSVSRFEVVKGPGSVAWGSDAIGGTVQAFLKGPFDPWAADQGRFGGELLLRHATADDSLVAHLDLAGRIARDTGLYLGGSVKDLGDVRAGEGTGDQPNTGYEEWGAHAKLEHLLGEDERLVLGFQAIEQDDVPRTHSTIFAVPFAGTSAGSDLRRDEDQRRQLAWVQLLGEELGRTIQRYRASLSWQRFEESTDRIRSSMAREVQGFDLDSLGLVLDASTADSGLGRFTFGADWYHDDVGSFDTTNPVQGPVADDATYDRIGVFVEDEIELHPRWALTVGGRFEHAAVDADSVLDPVTSEAFALEDEWSSLVGSVRVLHRIVEDRLHAFAGVSQGFRAPNLSDLTRFDSARSNEYEIPAPGLDPEHYLQYELGLQRQGARLSGEAAVFYTDIEDQIVRVPTGNVSTEGEAEVTKRNVGDGYLYGVEVGGRLALDEAWDLFGSVAFQEGRIDTFPTSAPVVEREYVDRVMPLIGRLGARWSEPEGRGYVETSLDLASDADKLSTRDEGDTQRIPPGGTPGYAVLDVRTGWRVSEHWRLEVALENVFDEDYRVHGSGTNRPGRSLVLGLVLAF